jgi:probable 2-oxoglutarate dehydrogenase E1 component DHKTD1
MMSLLDFENHANTCFQIVRDLCNQSFVRSYCCADTQSQLENRASNAALMRYVDSMRTHGHRAARIDPLDLIQREEVAALSLARYGLVDEQKKYNVNGILWRRARELGEEEDWLSLRDITEHLRKVYVGNIAYEVRFRPSFLLYVHLL